MPGSRAANLNVDSQTLTELVSSRPRQYPYSAFPLSNAQHHALDAQLQNVLKAPPSAPARVPAPGAGSLSSARTESDVATVHRAELEVNLLDGPRELFDGQTAVYTVGIWNNGGRADGTVELHIAFSGVLQGLELEQTPPGFTCTGRGTFVCIGSLGGKSDPVSSRGAVVKVRAHGAVRGAGAISANLDPNGRLSEANVANNNKTLPVTVK